MTRYHQGIFKPINPAKYKGDVNNICYRSSWEYSFFSWCDRHPDILSWQSEETVVQYRSPKDNKIHRYFIDIELTRKSQDGNIETFLVEIKPYVQTQKPKMPKKVTQKSEAKYINECVTYAVNQSKWKHAEAYAKSVNKKFIVVTEKQMGNILIGNKNGRYS